MIFVKVGGGMTAEWGSATAMALVVVDRMMKVVGRYMMGFRMGN